MTAIGSVQAARLRRTEHASAEHGQPEHVEVVVGDELQIDEMPLAALLNLQRPAAAGLGARDDSRQRSGVSLQVAVIGERKCFARSRWGKSFFDQPYELFWPFDRQFCQQERMDEAEHRGVSADAERQRQDRGCGEPRPPAHHADGVSQILTALLGDA